MNYVIWAIRIQEIGLTSWDERGAGRYNRGRRSCSAEEKYCTGSNKRVKPGRSEGEEKKYGEKMI